LGRGAGGGTGAKGGGGAGVADGIPKSRDAARARPDDLTGGPPTQAQGCSAPQGDQRTKK